MLFLETTVTFVILAKLLLILSLLQISCYRSQLDVVERLLPNNYYFTLIYEQPATNNVLADIVTISVT